MKLWFKSKRFGWGWQPCSWEGWVVTGVFVVLIIIASKIFLLRDEEDKFFFSMFVLIGLLIIICYKTGERPGWRFLK